MDRVEFPTFYIELSKFTNILKRLKENETTIRAILDRWIRQEQELSIICTEVVGLPFVSKIKDVFDQVFDLVQFTIDKEILQSKVRMCLIRYISKIFDIFPPMLTNYFLIIEKYNWMDELKVNVDIRMNLVVNEEKSNISFVRTTEEIVKVQIFFDSFKGEFKDLRTLARTIMKKESAILTFDWPNEKKYDQWKTKHSMAIERVHMVVEDKVINWVEEEQTNTKDT